MLQGKSVLSAKLVNFVQLDRKTVVIHHFCTYRNSTNTDASSILKSIVGQLVELNPDHAAYVFDNYIAQRASSSIVKLNEIISDILPTISSCRIIVDGLDECNEDKHQRIISELISTTKRNGTDVTIKLLIVSREGTQIDRLLKKKAVLSLSEEKTAIEGAIRLFTHDKLSELKETLEDINIDDATLEFMENRMVLRAEGTSRDLSVLTISNALSGMFLWVRLVIKTFENLYSLRELKEALHVLPEGLGQM